MRRILILDNRDSFVWNLAQAFMAAGHATEVRRSDAIDPASIRALAPDALVLSPGPGRPEDAGCSVEAVRALSGTLPILGICLGHQAIAMAFGARIDRGAPCHGKARAIHHDGAGLFAGQEQPLQACRYHSLIVAEPLPAELERCAWTDAGELMALRHRQHPTHGLQFHPESFRTPSGDDLLERFCATLSP